MKEADLKQQILTENLGPDNQDQVKKLDDFVCNILKDKCKQKDLDIDSTFEKKSAKKCLCDGPSVKTVDVSGRGTQIQRKADTHWFG